MIAGILAITLNILLKSIVLSWPIGDVSLVWTFCHFMLQADVLKESTSLKPLKQFKAENEKSGRKPSSANKANDRAEESNSASAVPYKSMNAYLVFCQFARKEILQIKPDISQIELTKLLAERWTHLKPEEKQVRILFCSFNHRGRRGSTSVGQKNLSFQGLWVIL